MNQVVDFEIPKYKIFDFHRHPILNLEIFEQNLRDFNINSFCLMPSMIEEDFSNYKLYYDRIQNIIKKYKNNCKVFGYLDFSKNFEQNKSFLLQQKVDLNIQGIKIHPDQNFIIKKSFLSSYFKIISDILGYNTPIYIHMDWPLLEINKFAPNGKKGTFNKIVSFFPDFKFIMGHAGGSGDYLNIWKSCKRFPNVYIETSMAPVTSSLEEVIWKIGHEKIIFGSNYPYCGTSIELVKILSLYKVTDNDKRAILESNWEALFSD
ncbi:MAG: amidohydrolase family protein [Promethearchaeota archaeon]